MVGHLAKADPAGAEFLGGGGRRGSLPHAFRTTTLDLKRPEFWKLDDVDAELRRVS